MQPWRHGPLYNTSDFDVGLNNGWALPNYRCWTRRPTSSTSSRSSVSKMVGGSDLAAERRAISPKNRWVPTSRRTAAGDARQPALQRGHSLRRNGAERRGHREVNRLNTRRRIRPTPSRSERSNHRVPQVSAELQRRQRLDEDRAALRGVQDDDPAAAGRHRAERVAERECRHADGGNPDLRRTSPRKPTSVSSGISVTKVSV